MTPRNHVLVVEGRTIRPLARRDAVVATSVEADTISIELREPADWDGLALHVAFASGCMARPIRVDWDGESALAVPWECCAEAGNILVTLVGLGDDGSIRAITRRMCDPLIVAAPGEDATEPPSDPTPDEYSAAVAEALAAAAEARGAALSVPRVEVVGELPEEPDEGTVYIVLGGD